MLPLALNLLDTCFQTHYPSFLLEFQFYAPILYLFHLQDALSLFIATEKISSCRRAGTQRALGRLKALLSCELIEDKKKKKLNPKHVRSSYLNGLCSHINHKLVSLLLIQNSTVTPLTDTDLQNGINRHLALLTYYPVDKESI